MGDIPDCDPKGSRCTIPSPTPTGLLKVVEQFDQGFHLLIEDNHGLAGSTKVEVDATTENAHSKIETNNSYLSSMSEYLYSFWGDKKVEEPAIEESNSFERREVNAQKVENAIEIPPLPYEAMMGAAENGVCQGASEVVEQVLLQRKGWTVKNSRTAAELGYMFSYAAVNFLHHYNKASAEGFERDEGTATYQAAVNTCADMLVLAGTRIAFTGLSEGIKCAAEYAQNAGWIVPKVATNLSGVGQHIASNGAFIQNIITGNVQGAANIAAMVTSGVAARTITKNVGYTMFSLKPQENEVEKLTTEIKSLNSPTHH